MSGNLFEDRNWLLPPNYLSNDNEHKTENEPVTEAGVTSPRPPIKEEEPKTICPSHRKMWLGTRLPFLQIPKERGRGQGTTAKDITQAKNTKNHRLEDPIL